MTKLEFLDAALNLLAEYAATHKNFLMEDVGEYAYAKGLPEPAETRWWGPVATKAKAAGIIASSGQFRMCSKGRGNPRYMMIWNSRIAI